MNKITFTRSNTQLTASKATYGEIMDSCDSLMDEVKIFEQSSSRFAVPPIEAMSFLPWRTAIHESEPTGNPLCEGNSRGAGIGIATLTVFNRHGEYHSLIIQRSDDVGTYRGYQHVVPAGMFNVVDEYREGDITTRVETEFLEEVISKGEFTSVESAMNYRDRVKRMADANLYGENGEYDVEIFFSGLALNLENLRPEICTLVLIKSPNWFDDMNSANTIHGNWEIERIKAIPITDHAELLDNMPSGSSVPSGAAALFLGLNVAYSKLGYPDNYKWGFDG